MLDYLLQPPVLFFLLGLFAVVVRSDLELPAPLPKVLSLYLLVAIGLKGGLELAKIPDFRIVAVPLLAALIAACVIPVLVYLVARTFTNQIDAGAIAATYGSVSAVTFIAATTYLDQNNIIYGGHMVAALALMESPAILIGLFLAKRTPRNSPHRLDPSQPTLPWTHLAHECTTNGAVLLLMGSLLIGYLAPPQQALTLHPFLQAAFPGVLCLFVLDLGMTVARQGQALRQCGLPALSLALFFPLIAGSTALIAARLLGLTPGDGLLFAVLCGSGSYLAVPAALRHTLPEANSGLYVSMSIGVTFPFNLILGIPLGFGAAKLLWS
jgi:uncharacterized protein